MVDYNSLDVHGTKVYYRQEGTGDPIVFLHGIPASSYSWRNIIPVLSDVACCIAPDLVGLGKSGKPDINYSLSEHVHYIDGFINKLNLTNITFVLHGLGSAIGFDYAMRNPDKVKAIAFYEAHIKPTHKIDLEHSLPIKQLQHSFSSNTKSTKVAHEVVTSDEGFVDKLLSATMLRKLNTEELSSYKQAFDATEHKKPIWQYIQDFVCAKSSETNGRIEFYSKKLQESNIPKLMFYNVPGFLTTMETVSWCDQFLPNLTLVDLEEGLHFAQENNPKMFGTLLRDWYLSLT